MAKLVNLTTSYIQSHPVELESHTLITDRIDELAKYGPDKIAFVFWDEIQPRETLSRGEVAYGMRLTATQFVKMGIGPGDRVAVLIASGPVWPIVQFGLYKAGAVAINSLSFDENQLSKMAEKLGCVAIVTELPVKDDQKWRSNILIKFFNGNDNHIIDMGKLWKEHCQEEIVLPKRDPDDQVVMFSTSGSTGEPKLVTHTHKSLIPTMNNVTSETDNVSVNVVVNDRPIFWAGGYPRTYIMSGDTTVYVKARVDSPKGDELFLDALIKENAKTAYLMGYRLKSLLRQPDLLYRMPRIRTFITGGQRVSVGTLQKMLTLGDSVYVGTLQPSVFIILEHW